jgi:hypothetical protein
MFEENLIAEMTGLGISPAQINRLRKSNRFRNLVDTAGTIPQGADRAQAILNEKIAMYSRAGIVTSTSFLRAEILLSGAVNNLNFNFLAAQQSNQAQSNIVTNRLLGQNDTFTTLGMAFYIKKTVQAAGVAPTDAQQAGAVLRTYANPLVFTGAESLALEAFYNGFVSVKIDTTDFIPSLPAMSFRRVATSQQTVGSSAASNNPIQADEFNQPFYGRVDVKPSFEFSGSSQISIVNNLPTSVNAAAVVNTGSNYAVMCLLGYLHSGAASEFQKRQTKAQKM